MSEYDLLESAIGLACVELADLLEEEANKKRRSYWVHPLNEKRDTLSACKTTLEGLSLYPKRFKPNTFLKATLNHRLLLQPRIYS